MVSAISLGQAVKLCQSNIAFVTLQKALDQEGPCNSSCGS